MKNPIEQLVIESVEHLKKNNPNFSVFDLEAEAIYLASFVYLKEDCLNNFEMEYISDDILNKIQSRNYKISDEVFNYMASIYPNDYGKAEYAHGIQGYKMNIQMSPDKEWRKLHTTQFNSVKPLGRTSYMKISGMPVAARDLYRDGYGEMKVKLMNLINVAFDNSKEVAQSALITVFCEFAFIPSYLLSENVKWEQIDDCSVKGTLSDGGIEVSGIFYFNDYGFFTRFETSDRYFTTGKNTYEKVKFSVVVESYKTQDNLKIGEKVKVMWNLPEGDYEYFKGIVDKIEFNVFK